MGLPRLYVLSRGVAGRGSGAHTSGFVWGAEHLLLTRYCLLEENTATALTFVEVNSLSKANLAPSRSKQNHAFFRGHILGCRQVLEISGNRPGISGELPEQSLNSDSFLKCNSYQYQYQYQCHMSLDVAR